MKYLSRCEAETEEIGKKVASLVSDGELVAMYGEMGSGKTVFARGFVHSFLPDEIVTSPTYALLNLYSDGKRKVNHFDLFRVESEEDLLSIGFWDVISSGVTLVEWAENVREFLPVPRWELTFRKTGDEKRELYLEKIER